MTLNSRLHKLRGLKTAYQIIMKPTLDQRQEWEREFDAAARRSLRERMEYSFIYTYKPILDDAKFRSFDTMKEYREWCRKNLPEYLVSYESNLCKKSKHFFLK